MAILTRLNQVIAEFNLLEHSFYQAWSRGELSQAVLRDYACQYYHQVQSFPRFISRVHTHCADISVRKVLLENLLDEELHGTDHPALWMQFANGLGAGREAVMAEEPLPETAHMVDTFYDLAQRDWRDGLCALYAYESQVPAVSASKIEGLKKWYGIQDEMTLAFFTAHQIYDVKHAEQVASLIEAHAEPEQAEKATREASRALWQFLDGICNKHGISCMAAA